MKKILIIFFGLILGCNLASARSVSCWEEVGTTKTPPTTSTLRTALTTAGSTPILVSALYEASFFTTTSYDYVGGEYVSFPGFSLNAKLHPNAAGFLTNSNGHEFPSSVQSYYRYYRSSSNKGSGETTFNMLSTTGTDSYTYITGYFIYTYCIVDEGSSGGGGGATGSVNFIIKATS